MQVSTLALPAGRRPGAEMLMCLFSIGKQCLMVSDKARQRIHFVGGKTAHMHDLSLFHLVCPHTQQAPPLGHDGQILEIGACRHAHKKARLAGKAAPSPPYPAACPSCAQWTGLAW
eukprot:1159207-Pelagomonas_calceolata.AAC.8